MNVPEKCDRVFLAILTCKSFVILGYRGEMLIEPSRRWSLPKFSSG